jgi:hypothetical protein
MLPHCSSETSHKVSQAPHTLHIKSSMSLMGLRRCYAYCVGTAPSLKTVVDTWQQSLLSAPHRPPEVYGQVQVMLEGDESGPH